jgi:ribosomal protein S8
MGTLVEKTKGACSSFCVCARVDVDREQIDRILNFIWSKVEEPKLPNQWSKYLQANAGYGERYDNCFLNVSISIDYSGGEMKRKIDEVLKMEGFVSEKKKHALAFKKDLPLQEARLGSRASKNEAMLKIELKGAPYIEDVNVSKETIEKLPKGQAEVAQMLDLAKETFKMPAKLLTCSTFRYDAKKFRPVGGLVLPTQLPMPLEVGSKIGSAQLYGVDIKLSDSKIGLEEVSISQEKGYLGIDTRGSFELSVIDKLLVKAFELSQGYSDLLVEET